MSVTHELFVRCTVERGTPVCSGGAGWWLGLGDNSKKLAWMNGMWESYGYLKAETEGSEDMYWESGWSGRTCDNRGFCVCVCVCLIVKWWFFLIWNSQYIYGKIRWL
jgi:hypothetical protein